MSFDCLINVSLLASLCHGLRELSFFMLGTGVEEFLEGYQIV